MKKEEEVMTRSNWSSGEFVVLKVCDSSGPMVGSSAAVADYFQDDARAIREWFRVLYLNSKNKVILNKLEFLGTVTVRLSIQGRLSLRRSRSAHPRLS